MFQDFFSVHNFTNYDLANFFYMQFYMLETPGSLYSKISGTLEQYNNTIQIKNKIYI